MSYRARILDFVDDLNYIAKDHLLFPERIGEFEISIKDGMKNDNGKEIDCARIYLFYKDKDMSHPVFIKDIIDESGFKMAYYEILRYGILGIDSVGQMKDASTDLPINILNFRTLLSEGLKQLKSK